MNKYQEALNELYKQRRKRYKVFQKHEKWNKEIKEYDKVGYCLQTLQELVDKETKYQSLEEELGIDLPILFKAKKVYFKYNEEDINIKKSYKVCFDITNSCLIAYEGIFDDFGTWLELKDYKKTWWLKENLEDGGN